MIPFIGCMASPLALVLPILLPSWRFFKTIEPSPRVEWAVIQTAPNVPSQWIPLYPSPTRISLPRLLWRMLWNPVRNDALFMVSCAERLIDEVTPHSIAEIRARVRHAAGSAPRDRLARFRLIFIDRDGTTLKREVLYLSDPFPLTG